MVQDEQESLEFLYGGKHSVLNLFEGLYMWLCRSRVGMM